MYHPPLYRKLLPWAYGLLFCVVAPTILFYTAGYRYNTKKAAIEKFGTLIVDSLPSDADIAINGIGTEQTTPSTFQELAPGWHRVRVSKDTYTSWEKTLEIKAERATFADRIQLFRNSPTLQLIVSGDVRSLAASPDRDMIFALESITPTSTRALLLQSRGRIGAETPLRRAFSDAALIRWQEDGRALVIDDADASDALIRFTSRGPQVTSTVSLANFWSGNELHSMSSSTFSRWNARTGALSTDPKPTSTLAQYGNMRLLSTRTSGTQLEVDRTFSTHTLTLPSGNWSFTDSANNQTFLRDRERWLWVDTSGSTPKLVPLQALRIQWAPPELNLNSALLLAGNELYSWTPGQTPTLLVRQSTPIREAVWHRRGNGIFVASDTSVEYVELDERGGHLRQPLIAFDHLQDVDVIGSTLYVAGTKHGQSGIWMATIE